MALQDQPGGLIICNGYKDQAFIKLALSGIKLGKKVIMVVEKLEELRQIITVSKQVGVEPMIGIRARLLSKGAGKWAESGGENAKFGLSTSELLAAAELLRAENLSGSFRLLHFHIGSQVPDILTVKKAVQEAARFYAKLKKMGFPIEFLDVGGGLGVDYDGSRSAFDSSTNYTLQEYTNDIVYYIADVCNAEGVAHPDIVSESGRALVIAVNKWDGLDDYQRVTIKREVERKLHFLDWAKIHFISARRRTGLGALMKSVATAHKAAFAKLPTPKLTRALQAAVERQAPPRNGQFRPKMRYAHQGGQNPPVVVIHGSGLAAVSDSYRRYLEGWFRDTFELAGTPLRIEFRSSTNPYADRRRTS
jgi:hypothetical protein